MLSNAKILELAIQSSEWVCSATDKAEWAATVPPDARTIGNYRDMKFARAIEREATAEATRIMREWADAREAMLNWQNRNVMYNYPQPMIRRVAAAEQAIRDFVERMK